MSQPQASEVTDTTSQGPMMCRGVRGATTVPANDKESILAATRELLFIMTRANQIKAEDVSSAYFTLTADLDATYPALAARQMGWYDVPLLCGREIPVPGGLTRCLRILLHWNTRRRQDEIVHVYLHGARVLRPDRQELPQIPTHEIEAAINGQLELLGIGEQ